QQRPRHGFPLPRTLVVGPARPALYPSQKRQPRKVTGAVSFSRGQGGEQGADLVVDVFRVVERPADLLAEQLAVALAQAVDRDLARPLRQSQVRGRPGVAARLPLAEQEAAQPVEQRALAAGGVLLAETGQHPVEQRQGPAALEQVLRRLGVL